jgi:nitrous oxide reductase accessory protein NosL
MHTGRRRFLALAVVAGAAGFSLDAAAQAVLRPGPKDICPVCGMLVSKYPNWTALVQYRDGHVHFFDGAKDLFKYLHDLAKYAPGHRREDIALVQVTDFYSLVRLDARAAFYVVGSDVLGPMGHELVPLASRADAEEFLKDHKGRRILAFGEVTRELPYRLDDGRF